jgi:hypothetical protein
MLTRGVRLAFHHHMGTAIQTAAEIEGYAGRLVVEAGQDPAKAHPLTYARMGYDNLSRMARATGFAVS